MADFFNPLPESVEWNGKIIRLTPAFDNVLNMYAALEKCITDAEKIEIMTYYLTDDAPRDVALLQKITDEIITKPKHRAQTEKAFDFLQDAEYIYAGFMQAYHLDLLDQLGKLHWWKFNALLKSLPQDTRFQEIVQIRLRPMPKATKYNAEERQNLLKLKSEYRLEISEKERKENLQNGLRNLASALIGMAQHGKS